MLAHEVASRVEMTHQRLLRPSDQGDLSKKKNAETYQSVFVGGLLPLLGHSLRLGLGEEVDGVEKGERDGDELGDLEGDLETLTLGGLSTGTMRTEGDPVGYQMRETMLASVIGGDLV